MKWSLYVQIIYNALTLSENHAMKSICKAINQHFCRILLKDFKSSSEILFFESGVTFDILSFPKIMVIFPLWTFHALVQKMILDHWLFFFNKVHHTLIELKDVYAWRYSKENQIKSIKMFFIQIPCWITSVSMERSLTALWWRINRLENPVGLDLSPSMMHSV